MTSGRRPNIVMVLTDDHGSQAIGAYGSVLNATPRIDEIGAYGWRFDNCFATNALCSPSRASILTGTYSHVNGVSTLVTPIDASQPTFVSQLKAAGYRTAMVGKWHMGEHEGSTPQGFDYWDILVGHDGQGEYWDPLFLSAEGERIVEGYATDRITDLAFDWLDSLEGDDPWCVLIYHKAPHRPWEPKPEDAERFRDAVPVPSTFWDDYDTRSSSTRRALMRLAENLNVEDLKIAPPESLSYEELALWKYQRFMEDYLACVASVDDNVGRITDRLRKRGEFDDTIVMYASDQGFFLGEHGWFDKRFMYEESLRMPMLLSYPRRLEGGGVFDGIVTNVDFAQTLLDAAGVPPHPRMQGRSFWPDLLGEPAAPAAEGMYYRYWEHDDTFHKAPAHYGYRTHRHKLIYYYNDGLGLPGTGPFTYPPEWELYDLERDPEELRNVAHDPAYAEVRAELERAMWLEQARLGDAPHPSQPRPHGVEDRADVAEPASERRVGV
ncbi:arylsulfatase A-like enzyme [Agromyces flavus]|uniref:Arylsulfatase A n=1 Tax=Agromyces flavus TaxID=589382 RepID=A0A1H1LH15_9MICO|nr:sulfatase [Agromyces flavus]MCP2368508.1 arylsulfatase A-like enzyme [Agromyces flavus]GGI48251.1 sulfatase [Agromyces flavus]SDR73844.1 Arylsulfatase A [Agromyces flavus]